MKHKKKRIKKAPELTEPEYTEDELLDSDTQPDSTILFNQIINEIHKQILTSVKAGSTYNAHDWVALLNEFVYEDWKKEFQLVMDVLSKVSRNL